MDYKLIRSKRKSIAIEIDRTGTVTVRAPYRMPNVAVKAFIEDKQDWIMKNIKKAQETALEMKDIEPLTEEELEKLYDEAKEDIPKRVRYYAELMGVDYGRISIHCQKTRWGSCSTKGNLNFNCLLMLAPSDVRDYVIIHELAHRKHMNHSKNFWKEVEIMIPDYKEKRKWLNTCGEEIIQRKRAMEYYGITDQVFYDVYVTSSKQFTDFEFEGYRYHHIRPSIELGIEKQEYSGGVFITDRERTALDCIKDMDKISGIEEVISNVDSIGRINESKLLKYLEEYDNQFLYQKTGYLLDNGTDKHGLSDTLFETCRNKMGKSKRYLTKDKTKGVYESKWQLVVPLNVDSMKNGEML